MAGDVVPVLFGGVGAVQGKRERIPGMGDEATDDRVLLISVGPPVGSYTARRLAEDGDLASVTTEAGDIVADPFDSETLVSQAKILGFIGSAWEAEDIETIVDCDDDDVLSVCEILAIVERSVGVADDKAWLDEYL